MRRLTTYKLAACGSRMPGAATGFTLGPDNVHFRRRLRRAHPETEEAMHKQRKTCVEVRPLQVASRVLKFASNLRHKLAPKVECAKPLNAHTHLCIADLGPLSFTVRHCHRQAHRDQILIPVKLTVTRLR